MSHVLSSAHISPDPYPNSGMPRVKLLSDQIEKGECIRLEEPVQKLKCSLRYWRGVRIATFIIALIELSLWEYDANKLIRIMIKTE